MKALVIDESKTPGSLRDLPDPTLEDNAVRVDVSYAGVNPVDWKIRDGAVGERTFPLVLGQDFAGTVQDARGDAPVQIGDRVFGCARESGSYAEETVVPNDTHDSPYARIPDGLSDALAAALPTPGLTALASLATLEATRGTSLLIVGAAGAVGSIAAQTAVHRGVSVTAVVLPGQGTAMRAHGVKDVVETDGSVVDAVRKDHPELFDAILDLVSDGGTLKMNAPLLRRGGNLVTTIHVADVEWFSERGIVATNIVMNETPQSSSQTLTELANLVTEGFVKVDIAGERSLDQAASLLDEISAGKSPGKFVLRVGA
jgi:NADPH:quinone reductase-like Zn-dependent oxidoreductase